MCKLNTKNRLEKHSQSLVNIPRFLLREASESWWDPAADLALELFAAPAFEVEAIPIWQTQPPLL